MHLTLTHRLGREGLSALEGKGVLENQMKMNWLDYPAEPSFAGTS